MAKKPQYFIFGDQSWPVESLAKALPVETPVSAWVDGRGWIKTSPVTSATSSAASVGVAPEVTTILKGRQQPIMRALLAAQHVEIPVNQQLEAVAIVGFQNPDISQKVVETLRTRKEGIKILEVGTREAKAVLPPLLPPLKRSVAWHDLMSAGMEQEIGLLSVQHRVQDLRDSLSGADEIAILLQDDPDPDGLASALALRRVLGRNAQTAPIVTFGKITRPENVAMSRLLGIEVETVNAERLHAFPKVVLVDCQPSFFKGRKIKADAILDHHPRAAHDVFTDADTGLVFEEIREELGALSTMMVQFLRAAHIEISQRLATALLYGIKSDTLLLNREVSDHDLDAFVFLYPKINSNTLRRIERPELPLTYLECLRKGLRHLRAQDGLVVLPLAHIEREEWIPQGADFALQVEGAQWAFACGLIDDKIVISGRNCGYVQHCGDLFKKLFDGMGCAGGHRTMAKALIPRQAWERRFRSCSVSPPRLARIIHRLVRDELDEQSSGRA